MALAMRDRVAELAAGWRKRGYELDVGLGLAKGFATIGAIGFEGRLDYGAIGSVTNLAFRLCSEARPGQVLPPADAGGGRGAGRDRGRGRPRAQGLLPARAGVQRAAAQAVTPAGMPASSLARARIAPIPSNASRASAASGSASSVRPARTSAWA